MTATAATLTCPHCNGTGTLPELDRRGTNQIIQAPCLTCNKTGHVPEPPPLWHRAGGGYRVYDRADLDAIQAGDKAAWETDVTTAVIHAHVRTGRDKTTVAHLIGRRLPRIFIAAERGHTPVIVEHLPA